MSAPPQRPAARAAGPELLCLQKWEDTAGWLLKHTAKWPKSTRFSFVQKVDNHALGVLEMLVVARYEPGQRKELLRAVNLRLEQLRFLLRMARARQVMPATGFETAMRGIDELGRMVHGWRVAIGEREAPVARPAEAAPPARRARDAQIPLPHRGPTHRHVGQGRGRIQHRPRTRSARSGFQDQESCCGAGRQRDGPFSSTDRVPT